VVVVRWDDACEALTERSLAVVGAQPGDLDTGPRLVAEGHEEVARKMLLGLLPDNEMDRAVETLTIATANFCMLLSAMPPQLAFASIYGVMTQQPALGLLAGRGS
jgi:hypothetical protein